MQRPYHSGVECSVEKEEVVTAEQSVENMSLRGEIGAVPRDVGSLVVEIFNLDPIIQQVQEKVQGGQEGCKVIAQSKRRGTRIPFPTDRSLRSKAKLSNNSFAALSDD